MLLFTTASGSCIVVGGLIAMVERIRPLWLEQELRHTIIAFGGGTLISAVALVLVPEGQEYLGSPLLGVLLILAGGIVFMLVEHHLASREHHLPQTFAMLLDFVPESLAMGGMFALGSPSAPLLAILIGLFICYMLSASTGVDKGIRLLSNLNVFLAIVAVFALLMMGLLNGKTQKIIDDINALPEPDRARRWAELEHIEAAATRRATVYEGAGERLAENRLCRAAAVDVRCVEKCDAKFECALDTGDRTLRFHADNHAVGLHEVRHRRAFLEALPAFLRRFPEYRPMWSADAVAEKSSVCYPGISIPLGEAGEGSGKGDGETD